jgi:hypothetical protein
MNNSFVFERAREFASRLRKQDGDDPAAWVADGCRIALGRPPSAAELKTALDLFETTDKPRALVSFCLMLYNLNEFIYVD